MGQRPLACVGSTTRAGKGIAAAAEPGRSVARRSGRGWGREHGNQELHFGKVSPYNLPFGTTDLHVLRCVMFATVGGVCWDAYFVVVCNLAWAVRFATHDRLSSFAVCGCVSGCSVHSALCHVSERRAWFRDAQMAGEALALAVSWLLMSHVLCVRCVCGAGGSRSPVRRTGHTNKTCVHGFTRHGWPGFSAVRW